ncbi:MAG TPA: histidine phosphatase family protein [Gammaproteobacteria bacterium]|nr:histidine phosphatase family protein [Gammaproteobacteria bacterium]
MADSIKRLTVVRHAKSSWKHAGLSDFDRPLNGRGQRDAPLMGKRLAKRGLQPQRLVSSPARRALTTARVIAGEIGYPIEAIVTDRRIYEASVPDLLTVIGEQPGDCAELMLVGHNPGLTDLCNHIAPRSIENLPTGGAFCVQFRIADWQEVEWTTGELVFFDFPKNESPP